MQPLFTVPGLNEYFSGNGASLLYGNGCCSSGSFLEMMGWQIGSQLTSTLLGNILGGGYGMSGYSMGGFGMMNNAPMGSGSGVSSGNTTQTESPTKEVDNEIKDTQTKIDNPEKYVDNINELNANIKTAEENLAKFDALQQAVNNAQKKVNQLEQYPVILDKSGSNQSQVNAYNRALETAQQQLQDAKDKMASEFGNQTKNNLEAELEAAKDAKEKAIQDKKNELEKEKEKLEKERQAILDEAGLSEALNKKDGSALSRLVDGKDSVKDKLAAFRKASDKYAQDPYSLSASEVETLLGAGELAAFIANKDNTESMQNVIAKLKAWASNSEKKETLNLLQKAHKQTITDKNDFNKLASGGFFTKSDRDVNGTKQTVYTGGGKSYYINNGQVVPLNKQNGNIFHKAKYEKTPNN